MKHLVLNDGSCIPWLAFGSGTALYAKNCTKLAARALALGFKHLDGAQAYENEDSLGVAIEEFLGSARSGFREKVEKRDEIYVTTKLEKIPPGQSVEEKLRVSLAKLHVDYVDLFLVHNPRQHLEREGGLQGVWKEMVDVKKKGLARSIGVSNFSVKQLEEIIGMGLDTPVVNQIEYHPLLAKRLAPLIAYHRAHNIVTASYGGLTPLLKDRFPSSDPSSTLATSLLQLIKVLNTLADGRGATPGQILLKWLQAEGAIAVTTSTKDERMLEYIRSEALDDLTESERRLVTDSVGDVQFRAFNFVPHMDEEGLW